MKARIKETGEPVEDLIIYDSTGNQWPLDEVELIPDTHLSKEIDWEERKFELVKVVMRGAIMLKDTMPDAIFASRVLEIADSVLAEYRKGGEE